MVIIDGKTIESCINCPLVQSDGWGDEFFCTDQNGPGEIMFPANSGIDATCPYLGAEG